MSPREKAPFATAAMLLLVAAAIFAGVHLIGQHALSRLLARDAVAIAELWSQTALKGGLQALTKALQDPASGAIRQELAAASIDALALVSPNGGIDGLGPGRDQSAEHLSEVLADAAETGASSYDIEPGAYTADTVTWLAQAPYRTWVLFPAGTAVAPRLAIRIDQTETAASLAAAFVREVLFSGGVAVITFVSFMAGFHYRQRKLAAENAAIRHLALHDELTGLPNRKQFEEFMAAALSSVETGDHKAAVFVLDLDGFKAVNDTLGHPVGDGLLKAAAKRLKASLRDGDLLARLSGDEFAIVVPKMTDPAMLAPLAERVIKLVSNPFRVDGHEVQVGCSIGLAVAPDMARTPVR